MAISKKEKLKRFFPSLYKPNTNPNIKALLEAIGEEDDKVVEQILNAKEQLFVSTAVGKYLDALGSNYGIERPITVSSFTIDDDLFRQIITILSFKPKQIKATMEELLAAFFNNDPDVFVEEVNPNEIIIQLPATLVNARDTLLGTTHIKRYTGEILSVDNTAKTINVQFDDESLRPFPENIHTPYTPQTDAFLETTIGNWKAIQGSLSLRLGETRDSYSGTSSLVVDKFAGVSNSCGIYKLFATPLDLTNTKSASFLIYLNDLTDITQVLFEMFSDHTIADRNNPVDGNAWSIPVTDLNIGWNLISVDLDKTPDFTFGAGVTLTNIESFRLRALTTGIAIPLTDVRFGYFQLSENANKFAIDDFAGFTMSQELEEFTIISNTAGRANVELTFDAGDDLSNFVKGQKYYILDSAFPGDFLFEPNGTFYHHNQRAQLDQIISSGSGGSTIQLQNALEIPDAPGFLVFNFGKDNEESLVPYLERDSATSVIIDPAYTFTKDHAIDDIVNVVTSGGFEPEDDGLDHAFYTVGTEEPVIIVQSVLDQLKASGTVFRFIIKF